jgi:alkaline phosphatase D
MTGIGRREFVAWAGAAAVSGCAVPAGPRPGVFRVSFGSCVDQTQPQPIWDTIIADRPDVFVFGGDNVYANAPFSPEAMQAAYAAEAAVPGFARLRDTSRISSSRRTSS